MKSSPEMSPSPDHGAHPMGGQRYNYSSAIKIFHQENCGPVLLGAPVLLPMPAKVGIPGCVCQAARKLLDKSQKELSAEAGVSKKTINDFENGFIEPKIALNNEIREALERAGANFVCGETAVGVVVYSGLAPQKKKTVVAKADGD